MRISLVRLHHFLLQGLIVSRLLGHGAGLKDKTRAGGERHVKLVDLLLTMVGCGRPSITKGTLANSFAASRQVVVERSSGGLMRLDLR